MSFKAPKLLTVPQLVKDYNKDNIKFHVDTLCNGNQLGTIGFPPQRAIYVESILILWWNHLELLIGWHILFFYPVLLSGTKQLPLFSCSPQFCPIPRGQSVRVSLLIGYKLSEVTWTSRFGDGAPGSHCVGQNNMMWWDYTAFLWGHMDSLVQDCGHSSALAMELPQSCSKPSDNNYLKAKWLCPTTILL